MLFFSRVPHFLDPLVAARDGKKRAEREAAAAELSQVEHVAQRFGHRPMRRVLDNYKAAHLIDLAERDQADVIAINVRRGTQKSPSAVPRDDGTQSGSNQRWERSGGSVRGV